MEFERPLALTLLLVPLGVGLYFWFRRSHIKAEPTLILSNRESTRKALPGAVAKRRRLPMVLGMITLALLIVGLAKPVKSVALPDNRATVMIVVDTSLSMLADDVAPTRWDAAKQVVSEVIEQAPAELNIGLVTFDAVAVLQTPPTQNRAYLLEKLNAAVPHEGGTVTGQGVDMAITSLQSFAAEDYPGRIYLISDGAEWAPTGSVNLSEATARAQALGYQINAVAYGTETGKYNGRPFTPDFASLEAAAEATGGTAVEAPTADALARGLGSIPEASSTKSLKTWNGPIVVSLFLAAAVLCLGSLVSARRYGTLVA